MKPKQQTPRCAHCKERFVKTDFRNKYCPKKECQEVRKEKIIEQQTKQALKNLEKIKADNFKKLKAKAYPKGKKNYLQDEVNKIARMIDKKLGYTTCIDCGKPFNDSIHAAHLRNVSGNENIRYNLHNLHSARGHCNQFSSEHKVGYEKNLPIRYNQEYFEFVRYEIGKKYKELKLSGFEYKQALKNARRIIREFDSYTFTCGIEARKQLNIEIGIYNE